MSGMTQPAGSLPELVLARARTDPHATILRRKDLGIWKPLSWAELAGRMRAVGAALRAVGLGPGDVAAILSDTRPEWAIVDLGIQSAGGICAGLDPSDTPAEIIRQLRETGSRLLFVENEAMLDKALEARPSCPDLAGIVVFDMKGLRDLADANCEGFENFLARAVAPDIAAPDIDLAPDAHAALIYTAGTSGPPRGVVFSHRNIMALAQAAAPLGLHAGDERLAFLPMCHVIERMLGLYLSLLTGTISNYVESSDTVPENLQELQPTVLIAPPRFWRRLHARITATSADATWLQRWLLGRTIAAGSAIAGGSPGALDRIFHALAARLVLRTVRRTLGLDRLRQAVIAFGAVPAEVADWFRGAGIDVVELYGLTETAGFGIMLIAAADTAARLSATGEILLHGAHISIGYWRAPGQTEAAQAEGWLATGDFGRLEAGRIVPAGRLAEGSAAAALETALRASPYVADAIALATGRDFVCLVMIDPDTVEPWAQRASVPFTGFGSLVRADPVRELIAQAVEAVNAGHAEVGSIRAFRLIEQRLEPGDPELSPIFSLRRAIVTASYRAAIETMLREA